MRTKVTPDNPKTSYQAESRNRLSTLATAWKGLTAAQRTAWNDAVLQYKRTDIFGDLHNPSGFNLFQKLNNNLAQIGVAKITTPPLPEALPVIVTGTLAAVHEGAVTVTFTEDPDMTKTEILVWATPAISSGKFFVKSELRVIGKCPALTDHVATLTTLYNAKFGAVGSAGLKLFVMLQQVSKTTGQKGIPVKYSCIIT
jgi:hypothetical protein